jgi:pimeloyl-ACP methyl ester carboxylesterase
MEAFSFPPEFRTRDIATNGTSIHVRSGGTGQAVVLLHGYGETGDMWAPMAVDLARDHTVVVPDLRGWASPPSRREALTRRRKRAT